VTEERKVSDVVADLERKVDSALAYLKNLDATIKVLLGNINSLSMKLDGWTVPKSESHVPSVKDTGIINKDNFDSRPKTSKFADMAAQHGIQVEEPESINLGSVGIRQSNLPPDPSGYDLVEAHSRPVHTQRGQRAQTAVTRVAVSQLLSQKDGTPLFLASIQVTNESGELVKQSRTNTKGRWNAALDPGDYYVRVLKRFSQEDREPLDVNYKIQVPPSSEMMELDPLEIDG
jgi:hypothetical protein